MYSTGVEQLSLTSDWRVCDQLMLWYDCCSRPVALLVIVIIRWCHHLGTGEKLLYAVACSRCCRARGYRRVVLPA
jgi:hypothetical protein